MLPSKAKSSAEVALRFVLSNPGVSTAISGMNTIAMVEENVATASRGESLFAEEKQAIEASLVENKRLMELYCTGCKYCMPCPNDVNIAENFRLMNLHKVYGLTDHARNLYNRLSNAEKPERGKKAEDCIECGECEPKCPQKIKIMEQLREVAATFRE
jgi:predicted aldo/keto reductase-like oxidoreductase